VHGGHVDFTANNRYGDTNRAVGFGGAAYSSVDSQEGTCITDPSGRDVSFGAWIRPSNTGFILSSGAQVTSGIGLFLRCYNDSTLWFKVAESNATVESKSAVHASAGCGHTSSPPIHQAIGCCGFSKTES